MEPPWNEIIKWSDLCSVQKYTYIFACFRYTAGHSGMIGVCWHLQGCTPCLHLLPPSHSGLVWLPGTVLHSYLLAGVADIAAPSSPAPGAFAPLSPTGSATESIECGHGGSTNMQRVTFNGPGLFFLSQGQADISVPHSAPYGPGWPVANEDTPGRRVSASFSPQDPRVPR